MGWLCRVTITRFSGVETYHKTTPLFLGLALGDIAMILFWLVIDDWQGRIAIRPYSTQDNDAHKEPRRSTRRPASTCTNFQSSTTITDKR